MKKSFPLKQISMSRVSVFFGRVIKCTVLIVFALTASLSQATTLSSDESLMPIPSDHFDLLKIADTAKLPNSSKIYVADVDANFDRDWLMQFQTETTKKYRSHIEEEYANMLKGHLIDKLKASGWTVVDSAQSGALTLKAEFKDLHINGPEKRSMQNIMVHSVGKASIVLTVEDTNQQPFLVIEDRRNAGGIAGGLMETDRAMNYSLFSKLARQWSATFVAYLDLSTPGIARQ